MRLSLKNSQMKGAERFRQNSLLFSDACFATFRMDSRETVRKKPWKQTVTFDHNICFLYLEGLLIVSSGVFPWVYI